MPLNPSARKSDKCPSVTDFPDFRNVSGLALGVLLLGTMKPTRFTAARTKLINIQAISLALCAPMLRAKDKPASWQDAQVLDISSERIGEGGIHQIGGKSGTDGDLSNF